MRRTKLFYGLCLICLFLAACVSKDKYEDLEARFAETLAQLEQKNNEIQSLESKLKGSEEKNETLQQEYSELKVHYQELENTKLQLSQRLEGLGVELKNKDSIVKQKEDVLREYDEAKRSLESELTSLQVQIEAREQKIKEKEAALKELANTKRKIETSIQDLESNLADREKKIKEQAQIINELDGTKREIEVNLKEQIKTQQIKLEEMEGKLKVTFIDKILFDSGSVKINKHGKDLLSKLAQTLREREDQTIIIQGHTDNVEIGPELRKIYPTNWELSAGRSTAVLRFLIENAGIAPGRCTACGYSFQKPVASNESEEGRQQNRRIEIVLVPVL
jgi:chemotaxis protein MotB